MRQCLDQVPRASNSPSNKAALADALRSSADPASYHRFMSDGMVHGPRLQGGRALWYGNRWIRSEAVGAALSQPPAPGPRYGGFDTVNTSVVDVGGSRGGRPPRGRSGDPGSRRGLTDDPLEPRRWSSAARTDVSVHASGEEPSGAYG